MNSLFIGLGGAGISSVAEFAMKVRDHGADNNNEYLYLDTDESSKELYPFIEPDFVHLGGATRRGHSIANMILNAARMVGDPNNTDVVKKKFVQFLQWYDTNIVSKEELTKGAEGIRMLSRAMLFADYDKIRRTITGKMFYIDANNRPVIRKIYVVSGTCGGTGSGCVIDILYMLNEIRIRQNYAATQLPINLLLVMPQGYLKDVSPQSSLYAAYRLNAYAIIDEVNGLLKDYYGYCSDSELEQDDNGFVRAETILDSRAGMQMNKYRCCDNDANPFQFDVFQNAFLFDSVTSEGLDLSHKQRSENVANFLFVLEVGRAASGTLDSNISNHIRTEKFNSAGAPFIKGFAATGMFVAQTWEELTRKYVKDRFIYEMLRYGFIGEDADKWKLPGDVLQTDTDKFNEEVENIINSCKERSIMPMLTKVLSNYDYTGLEKVFKNMQCAFDSNPSIETIFVNCNDTESRNSLSAAIYSMLNQVKELAYKYSVEWLKKYNLNHSLQLVNALDVSYDRQYKEKFSNLSQSTLEKFAIKPTEKRRKQFVGFFELYLEYIVFRNLSFENSGYLDDCRVYLKKAIAAIDLPGFEIDEVKVVEWEQNYFKYINGLISDNTRAVYPNLNMLFDGRDFVKGNQVEQDYVSLVAHNGTNPDLTYNLGNARLIYTFKNACFDKLSQNRKWDSYFVMDRTDVFAANIRVAFEEFSKMVKEQAEDLSKSPALSKPFTGLNLSQDERKGLIQTLEAFDSITLATRYEMDVKPNVSIYVADFNQMSWLNSGLFPPGYNQMEKTGVSDNTIADRVVKLYVEFGHPIDDYRYYEDEYLKYYKSYLTEFRGKPRHHQPYIDLRFWNSDCDTVAELFDRNVRKDAEQSRSSQEVADIGKLKSEWRGHNNAVLVMVASSIYYILENHKDVGVLGSKMSDTSRFFKILKRGSKETGFRFDTTKDFIHNHDRSSYNPNGQPIDLEFGKEYPMTGVKKFSEYLSFWYQVLSEIELDSDSVKEALVSAWNLAYDRVTESDFISEFWNKYGLPKGEDSSTEQMEWKKMVNDFLLVFHK